MTSRYVAGFAFCGHRVLLIRKSHPQWQRGKLNAVGGHIEQAESPIQAMVREFREETSLVTEEEDWTRFCVLRGESLPQPNEPRAEQGEWEVHFFRADLPHGEFIAAHNFDTSEPLSIVSAYNFPLQRHTVVKCIPNLNWLVPMAMTIPRGNELLRPVREMIVTEQYRRSHV